MSSMLACHSMVHTEHIWAECRILTPSCSCAGPPLSLFANQLRVRLTVLPVRVISHRLLRKNEQLLELFLGRSPLETGRSKLAKAVQPIHLQRVVEDLETRGFTAGSGGLYDRICTETHPRVSHWACIPAWL